MVFQKLTEILWYRYHNFATVRHRVMQFSAKFCGKKLLCAVFFLDHRVYMYMFCSLNSVPLMLLI